MPSMQRLQISPTPRLGGAPSGGKAISIHDSRDVGAGSGEGAGGRRAEFHALHKAYLSADAGPQVAVVTGPSGIGKSYFVAQSLRVICRRDDGEEGGSFVVSGKCNEMNQNQPYSSIVEALGMLCKQLSRRDLLLDSIREDILTALNGEGAVLVDFVPTARDVLGEDEHNGVRELKGKERRVRLERVVRRFLKVVSSYCPVVVVLDDLQWADGPTMNLVRSLATSPSLRGLLLVCIYREDDKRNMLDKHFLEVGDDANITNIRIEPLTSMRGLVDSSGLDLTPDDATRIAEWLQEHSKGNTFFAVRLLGYLLFRNDAKPAQIVDTLESMSIPPTLEDLLSIEIRALPPFTRDALIRASCIGLYFDDFVLKQAILLPCIDDEVTKLASFRRQSCLSEGLVVAQRMGLVEEMGSLGYRFVHDSMWKAFYSMLSTDNREMLHLEIGRVMKKRLQPPSQDNPNRRSSTRTPQTNTIGVTTRDMDSFVNRYLCSTVDQFNRAGTDHMSSAEVVELLLMNIRAAELSSAACSWKSAVQYLDQTKPMLQKDEHWLYRYDMCLLVNNMDAEINLSLCNFERAASTVDIILRHGQSIDDTYGAYLVLMRSLNSQKKTAEALSIASDVLEQLGVEAAWIKQDATTEKDKFRKQVKKQAKKQSWVSLSSLKQIDDERKLKAIKIFYWLLVATYGTELHELVAGKIFLLTIEHGFSEEGINGILTYASGYLPLSKKKNEMLRAAIQLHKRVKTGRLTHDYCLILGGYLQCWSDPLRESLATLLEGLKVGAKHGHIDNAALCGSLLSSYSLFSGEQLATVEDRMRSFADWAKEERLYGSSRLGFLPYLQLVKCLQQGGNGERDSVLAGKELDTDEMKGAAAKSPMVSCSLVLCQLELACIMGDHSLAGDILLDAPNVLELRPGHFSGCRFTLYEFLASAELARGSKKSSWSKRASVAQKQIQEWARNGVVNCDHLIPLVEAEMALVKGKRSSASKHYARVVKLVEKANGSGYNLQDRAISVERAAHFYHSQGDIPAAASCYAKSRDLYEEWGATRKAEQLKAKAGALEAGQRYSQMLKRINKE
ncbi:hypothetical protein ACHAXT_008977 [Thalassiosira profunda]